MKTNTIIITILWALSILIWSPTFGQGLPAREETGLDQVYEEYNLSGENVVIAFIDRGIDYFHPDFIDENGETRLLFLYDLTNQDGANDPNNPYGVGTIYSADELNASLSAGGDPLSMDFFGHGTAISGIASGNGSAVESDDFQGVAPKSKIIAIKAVQDYFPPFDDQPGQDGLYDPTYIPISLQFISDKMEDVDMPCVALLNMGSIGGPTDGTSTICQAMDNFVDQGHTLVCGVGDDGGNDNHASTPISEDEVVELEIQKGEEGNLRFECWYSEDDRFQVTITRPDNTIEGPFLSPATENNTDYQFLTGMNYYHLGANYDFAGASSWRRQIMIDIFGETGTYKVKIEGSSIGSDGLFHSTLNPSTYYNTNKFMNYLEEGTNVNDFTTSANTISPGDYVVKNDWIDMGGNNQQMMNQGDSGELWAGSSWGPAQNGEMAIDFAACGEVLYGAYSPNTWYSHFPHLLLQGGDSHYGIQNAVSAAAPLTTGIIALMLEMKPDFSAAEINEILQQTAESDDFTGEVPNNQWGYGKLNAYAAIQAVDDLVSLPGNRITEFSIVPNPASEKIKIKLNGGNNFSPDRLMIRNMMGEMLLSKAISSNQNINVAIHSLPAGIYIVELSDGSSSSISKFIIR